MIDPEHPDLGPKNNQFAFVWGRMKNGRGDLVPRFVKDGFGSINANGHTTVCQGSLYFTGKAMSEQCGRQASSPAATSSTGRATPATASSSSTSAPTCSRPTTGRPQRAPKMTEGLVNGAMKYAVLDPRLEQGRRQGLELGAHQTGHRCRVRHGHDPLDLREREAQRRLPVERQQGGCHRQQGSHLDHTPPGWSRSRTASRASFVRGSELGWSPRAPRRTRTARRSPSTPPPRRDEVHLRSVRGAGGWQADALRSQRRQGRAVSGDLLVTTKIGEFDVKTGLQMIAEAAQAKTIAEWAEIAGVERRGHPGAGAGVHQPRHEGRGRHPPWPIAAHQRLLQQSWRGTR